MTTIAQLGIQVDSSQAAIATANLHHLSAAANDAEEAAGGNVTAWGKVGEEFEKVVKHTRAHVLSLAGATEGTRAFTGILAHLPGPLLLAVAGIGALTFAYIRGEQESTAYAKALALTGNASGVTVGQLAIMAETVGKVAGNTHTAAAALAVLAQTGAVGGQNLQEFATIAIEVEEKLGQTVEQTAKNFADLANDPLAATIQLGKALGYLTPQLYDQIRAYQQQGDTVHAAATAQQAYADANAKAVAQVTPNLGVLARAWNAVKDAASNAASAAAGIGRQATPEQQLRDLQAQRGSRQLGTLRPGFDTTQQLINDRAEQRLQKLVDTQKAQAAASAAQAQQARVFTESLAIQSASLDAAAVITKAYYEAQTQNVQRTYTTLAASIQAQDDLLQAQRSANLLDDQEYFSAKLKLIQQSGVAQTAEIDKEIALTKAQAAQEAALLNAQIAQNNDPAARAGLQAQQVAAETAATQKIKDLQAQRAQSAIKTASEISLANLDEGDSIAALTRSYADLIVTSDRYAASLQKQYQLTLQGIGAGNQARQRATEQATLTQHFEDQLDSNLDARRNGRITQEQFDLQNSIIQKALSKSQGDFDTYYKALDEKQSDWVNGAKEAFQNYIDEGKNVAGMTNTAFSNSFRSIEDSITNFVTTGKFSFKDLANSIISELVRIEIRILESQALQSIFGSAFGAVGGGAGALSGSSGVGELSGSTVAFAASGADTNAGQPFIVGERGPELFVPNQAGSIVPNGQWGGGSGVNITSINNFGPGSQVGALSAELDRRDAQIRADVNNSIARGQWNTALRAARA